MLDNSRAKFIDTIDVKNSPFRADYNRELSRLSSAGQKSRFKLEPDAVMPPLLHALESPSPKARYRVTTPAKIGAILKRLLPTRLMDRVLIGQR